MQWPFNHPLNINADAVVSDDWEACQGKIPPLDGYSLILLAQKAAIHGRVHQAEALVEAAFLAYDRAETGLAATISLDVV